MGFFYEDELIDFLWGMKEMWIIFGEFGVELVLRMWIV